MKLKPTILFAALAMCATSAVYARTGNLFFTENKGQVTDQYYKPRTDIDFKLGDGSLNVFIGDGKMHYQFSKIMDKAIVVPGDDARTPQPVDMYRMDVELVGANPDAEVIKGDRQAYYENYYTPGTGTNGATVHQYARVTYKNIYPKIDWVLYVQGGRLKHEFVVNPGGKVGDIKLKYSGATKLEKNNEGGIVATTPMGTVAEHAPFSYIGSGKEVASSFVVSGDEVSYALGSYTGTLVIDPTLVWSTYYGGFSHEMLAALRKDAAGNIYLSGSTYSIDNIATVGAFQAALTVPAGGFVVKMDANSTRQWGTYLQGDKETSISTAWADKQGNIYVSGSTESTAGITTPGVAHPTFPTLITPFGVVFVNKFNTNGGREWGSYIPPVTVCLTGMGALYIYNDFDGDVAVVINEYCPPDPFMATTESTMSRLACLSPQGTAPTQPKPASPYSNPIFSAGAGSMLTAACSDDAGYLCVAGFEVSFPPTAGNTYPAGSHSTYNKGMVDGFIRKFGKNASMDWGTFFGGSDNDRIYKMAVDKNGSVYISGFTNSNTDISTPGSMKPAKGPGAEMFISKFTAGGQQLWGTYVNNTMMPDFLAVDDVGGIYMTQVANNLPGLATTNAWQQNHAGKHDILMTRYHASGKAISWAGYCGGAEEDGVGFGISTYLLPVTPGSLYLASCTNSPAGIATAGTHQTTVGGSTDLFVAKIQDETAVNIAHVTGQVALNIYPNPFAETITIDGSADGSTATITDMPGRAVCNAVLHANSNTINTKQLAPGMYILQVKDAAGNTVHTSKVIKQAN